MPDAGDPSITPTSRRYGNDAVQAAIREIMNASEALARQNTLSIPDGVYEAESFMDDDGLEVGKRIPIRVKVTVKGDEMEIDLSDVSRQVKGFYNSGFTTGIACLSTFGEPYCLK